MVKSTAELTMERETRVSFGEVPTQLDGVSLNELSWRISPDQFLLRATGNHYFHYRRGEGIRIQRGADAQIDEETLWLNGSVYAAVASMNGLLPIHASAVAVGRAVFAFTGPPAAGKSTLIAALGKLGFPMFCDDTLVLDLSDPDQILCLPGHKKLKLTSEALALTGIQAGEKVSQTVEKFYCKPPAGEIRTSLRLHELIFLEEGSVPTIAPISGFARFERITDEHYTADLYAAARQLDRSARFQHLSDFAGRVEMSRFVRPREEAQFHEGVKLIASYLGRCSADEGGGQ